MTPGVKQILVPIDFSEQSIIALKQSYNLARLSKAEITLLHVADESTLEPLFEIMRVTKEYTQEVLKTFEKKLLTLAEEVTKDAHVKVNVLVRTGKIYEVIAEEAENIDAYFIVMGTNGPIGIKKKFIGSNALRVIREAKCPVISIKGKSHRQGCKTIVLPLDLTRETKEKVNKAIELANYFAGAIKVITINDSKDEFITNKLKRQMDQVVDYIGSNGLICSGEFIHGTDIAREVMDYSVKVDADLIMIMTQQELYLTELFIGSSAQEIINESEIPVCSIRPTFKGNLVEFVTS
ncbi:MAG TPA: universal stress protein [Bacteroidia bacterium]|nr:universal stress protein [Bacteroidia bacterium]HNT80339.1 universal stress protein [Bacteroidia bacterium]